MRSEFRPEIQALRAVSVLLVVLFHLWPGRLTGGYVGVDVFFVISGYLITSHLLREVDRSGTIKLSQFYARRIRRLLPAALSVLAVTLVAVLLLVPQTAWRQILTEIGASALYFVNWVLAFNAVDYFAAENLASPVQHYWSLSVEEQFYLVWPLLILAGVWVTRKASVAARKVVLVGLLAAIFVACLAYSIVATAESQEFAYFATPAHGWEFAAGGLLAMMPVESWRGVHHLRAIPGAARWAALASWAGFALIVLSAVVLDANSLFPGYIALVPIGGALLVMAVGMPQSRLSPGWLIRWRPVQLIGDVSYSLYLWHWPLIVLAPALLDREIHGPDKLIILAIAIALAWLSKHLIEDPFRLSPRWTKRLRTYAAAVAASALLVTACVVPIVAQDAQAVTAESWIENAIATEDPCFGALAVTSGESCEYLHEINPVLGVNSGWPPADEHSDTALDNVCDDAVVRECISGSPDPETVIALVGDSHMDHYSEALRPMLDEDGIQFRAYLHNACPALLTEWERTTRGGSGAKDRCTTWRDAVVEKLAMSTELDAIVVSNYTNKFSQIETAENRKLMAEVYAKSWKRWTDVGIPVIVIADNPLTNKQNIPDCVAEHLSEPDACALPREQAVGDDPLVRAANEYPNPLVTLIDLSNIYCDETLCRVVIGGVIAYSDKHHLSESFARSLSHSIVPEIRDAISSAEPQTAG